MFEFSSVFLRTGPVRSVPDHARRSTSSRPRIEGIELWTGVKIIEVTACIRPTSRHKLFCPLSALRFEKALRRMLRHHLVYALL